MSGCFSSSPTPKDGFTVDTRHGDLLVPYVWRLGADRQSYLFEQLAAQGGERRLPAFDASARGHPDDDGAGRLRNGEAAQQDAVVLVEDDRTDRVP